MSRTASNLNSDKRFCVYRIIIRYVGSLVFPALIFGIALYDAQEQCDNHRDGATNICLSQKMQPSLPAQYEASPCLVSAWSAWEECDFHQCTRSKHRNVQYLDDPHANITVPCHSCSTICSEQCLAITCRMSSVCLSCCKYSSEVYIGFL